MSDPPPQRPRSLGIWPPDALLGEEILEATVDLVIGLVTQIVDQASGISVSLLSHDTAGFHTPSATSTDVREVDAVQYETDQGPCVEAARTGTPVNVVIADERERWPEFACHSAERGMVSVLSVPLLDGEGVIGALNVYSDRPHAFTEHDQRVVGHFAQHAAVLLTHASVFMTSDWISDQLEEALSMADVIGQAKGILLAKGYSAEEALASLRRASDRTNQRLSDVAYDIVASTRRARSS